MWLQHIEASQSDHIKTGGNASDAHVVTTTANRQPNGNFRSKAFIEPVTGKVFRSVMAVKRFLQLDLPPGATTTAAGECADSC